MTERIQMGGGGGRKNSSLGGWSMMQEGENNYDFIIIYNFLPNMKNVTIRIISITVHLNLLCYSNLAF